jgi:hypothetical protein
MHVTDSKESSMGNMAIRIEWVLLPLFCALTGYTEKAVRRKIEDGVWLQGKHYKKVCGRIHMSMEAYRQWVEQAE